VDLIPRDGVPPSPSYVTTVVILLNGKVVVPEIRK